MLTHDQFLARRRFDKLDGLRALSILLVFTAHPASQQFWPHFHGQAGVTLFFVLSGFLITTLLLREEQRNGRVSFRAFYLRRLFRIYPMFVLVFLGYCALILVLGLQPDRREAFVANIPYFLLFFPEHAIFFNNFPVEVPFNMTWSIGIEEKFYVVWPLLGFLVFARARRWRVPFLLGVLAIATTFSLLPGAAAGPIGPYAPIALGALAAVLLHAPAGYQVVRVLGRRLVLALLCLTAVALQFGTAQILVGHPLYVLHAVVITGVLVGLVTSEHPEYRWLSSRPLVYLGALSYVLYLIHNFGLNFVEMIVPHNERMPWTFLSTGLGIGLAVVAAHFLHRWFEEPLRRYGVRLSRRTRPEAELPAVPDPELASSR